jgi:hypothetical protein
MPRYGSSVSIYNFEPVYSAQGVSIYKGVEPTSQQTYDDFGNPCTAEDTCMTDILLQQFLDIVESVKTVVQEFFPASNLMSTAITKIKSLAFLNDYTYVRFMWISRHPGMIFDDNNLSLRYEIKDIYLEFGLTSWDTDPLVNTL